MAHGIRRGLILQNKLRSAPLKNEDLYFGEKLYEAVSTLQDVFPLTPLIFLLRHSGTLFCSKKQPWSKAKMARLSFAID